MKRVIVMLALVTACGDEDKPDSAEIAAVKAECKALLAHIVQVSPQAAGHDAAKLAAALPVEEVEQCTASEPEIRQCMTAAADVAAIKKCIPTDEILGCMQKAKKVPAARARCWAGDPHAADAIKAED